MRRFCVSAVVCLATLAWGQVNYTPMPVPEMQFTDQNGVPLAGGCLVSYAAGTTTPQATYTDYTGTVQNSNPVTLDSAGRAPVFLGNLSYKFQLTSAPASGACSTSNLGTQQWVIDGVAPIGAVLAAPPAIGSTTANSASFTMLAIASLTATGTVQALSFVDTGLLSAAAVCTSAGGSFQSCSTTGSGAVVLQTSPQLVTPNLGVAAATSVTATGALQGATITDTGVTSTPVVAAGAGGILQAGTTTGTGSTVVLSTSPVLSAPTTNSIAGTGTATFAAGAGAGTSPGTPACAASHVCDSLSGTVALTMGTTPPTTGVVLTVTTNTRTNQPNCAVAMNLTGSPYTPISVYPTYTTNTIVFNLTGTAPTASVAYTLTYSGCGGN